MIYHFIGDSNCIYNCYGLPRCVEHHLGAVRMRDIADKNHCGFGLLDLRRWKIEAGDKCFFMAGEIDVRCDLHRAIADGANANELIAELVRRYVAILKENEMPRVEFWLVSVLPTANSFRLPTEIKDHPIFPYVGGNSERADYTLKMNLELALQATVNGYGFLNIYPRYADEWGILRHELSSYMHVGDNSPILAEMHAQGLYTDEEAGMNSDLAQILKTGTR